MRSVRIQSDGTPHGTKVFDAGTGAEIKGIMRVSVDMAATRLVEATIEFGMVNVSTEAQAKFVARNPKTDEYDELASVTFADGTTVTF